MPKKESWIVYLAESAFTTPLHLTRQTQPGADVSQGSCPVTAFQCLGPFTGLTHPLVLR